jgi:hypothetical protein
MRRYRALAGMLAMAVVMVGGAGSVGADPIDSPNSEVITLSCETNGIVTVVVNGNGVWTPGHVTTNNQVGIPYEFHITGTFTPADGGPTETFTDDLVKPAPRNGRLDTCTFHQEGEDEFGTFVVDGTVAISYTPAQ